jgi:hypothetical protein
MDKKSVQFFSKMPEEKMYPFLSYMFSAHAAMPEWLKMVRGISLL